MGRNFAPGDAKKAYYRNETVLIVTATEILEGAGREHRKNSICGRIVGGSERRATLPTLSTRVQLKISTAKVV